MFEVTWLAEGSRPAPGAAMRRLVPAQLVSESGQGLVEYALILVIVSIVAIFLLVSFGSQLNNMFSNVVSTMGA